MWFFILALVLTATAAFLDSVRNDREKRIRRKTDADLKRQEREITESYLYVIEEMAMSAFMVAGGLRDMTKQTLVHQMEQAQHAILKTVRNRLGPEQGVRSCMFVVDPDNPTQLKAFINDGRLEPPSTRTFGKDDKTFQLAIAKLDRFEEDIEALEEENYPRPLRYRTFATWPISTDENLYGILTIDAPQPGDIGERDRALLSYFAAILTITFVVQKDAQAIRRSDFRDMWENNVITHTPKEAPDD